MIEIDDLLDIPYCNNGRDISSGLDCYGLAIEVSRRFGHNLYDVEDAMRSDRDFADCENQCVKKINVKKVDEPKNEGDIILIKDMNGINSHIGVYLGNGKFIHCNSLGVHLDNVSRYKQFIGRVYTWL